MKNNKRVKIFLKMFLVAAIGSALVACHSATKGALDSDYGQSQVQTRKIQSRAFDTSNQTLALRTTISTLQDLGFVLDKADVNIGTVSATKFVHSNQMKATVSIRPHGNTQTVVRMNAQYGTDPIQDPLMYQDFFKSLSKGMFLDAHEVE